MDRQYSKQRMYTKNNGVCCFCGTALADDFSDCEQSYFVPLLIENWGNKEVKSVLHSSKNALLIHKSCNSKRSISSRLMLNLNQYYLSDKCRQELGDILHNNSVALAINSYKNFALKMTTKYNHCELCGRWIKSISMLSMRRVSSKIGYTEDNVAVICTGCDSRWEDCKKQGRLPRRFNNFQHF